ncbi:hypothetical protein I552_6052 [Mycobacterium xenopi 3993]|nr:hypothetical protein I552_6052 [Mycobacterium xenopi 3993]
MTARADSPGDLPSTGGAKHLVHLPLLPLLGSTCGCCCEPTLGETHQPHAAALASCLQMRPRGPMPLMK